MMDVRLPDGTIVSGVPDNITKAELVAKLQLNGMSVPGEWLQDAPQQSAGQRTQNADLASQLGLTLRAGLKGALSLPALGADAIGGALNAAQDLALGKGGGYRFQQTLPTIDAQLSRIGIPEPDTPLQRIVGKTVETGLGALGGAKMADLAARGTTGTTQTVLQRLAADPAGQTVAGMGAGAAGQQSAETGSGWGGQALSALMGGLGAAGAVGATRAGANTLRAAMAPAPKPADIERTITIALERQGVDPASVTPALKAALMRDVQAAMKTSGGTLDEAALGRLADYRRLGLTPTRGRVTLDPLDVTREQNAMRLAAASGARDARLPQIAQGNNARLLDLVDGMNPTNDRAGAGEAVMRAIRARDASQKARVDALYGAARDSQGRGVVLDGMSAARRAIEDLEQSLAPKLGTEVDDLLNSLRVGNVPLTVDLQQQLLRDLGRKIAAAKGTNGDLAHGLGVVRRAIEEADVLPASQVNPRNLPAVPGTVPPSPMQAGQEAIDAFTRARAAARERFTWQESAPGIARALDDAVNADTFVRANVISESASLRDVATLAQNLDAAGREAVRGSIVQQLKKTAIGRGNNAETANMSGRQWLSALDSIGDRKLALFFSPEEVAQLRAIGRVGTIEIFQPRGSAVNNSNTAAGLASLFSKVSDSMGPVLGKVPGGQAFLRPALDNITVSLAERGATNAPAGLLSALAQSQKPPAPGLLDRLLLPYTVSTGGLLSSVAP